MTTFISIRVSTREQSVDGQSLPAQIRECLAYCRLHGLDADLHPDSNIGSPGVFADPGVSAWKCRILERPGFLEVWRRAQPGDKVVFLSMDRAFRSVRDFSISMDTFRQKQLVPIFAKGGIRFDTAAGSLWARVLASFAEYQSELLSERMRESWAIRKSRSREGATCDVEKASASAAKKSLARARTADEISEDIRRIIERRSELKDLRPKGRLIRYIRVSTDDQNSNNQSVMLDRYKELYLANGYSDGGEFIDHGVSAFYKNFRDRPAGGRICEMLQPGDMILVTRLDRIFRSTIDMGTSLQAWESHRIGFTDATSGFDTSTLDGRMMANFMCVMAQWESESISWRTSLGMKMLQMKRGPWFGKLPRWVRSVPVVLSDGTEMSRLEVIPEFVRDIRHVRKLREEGLPIGVISDILQREYEIEHGIPVEVPRSGIGSRWVAECKLRRNGKWDELKQFQTYCEKNGIGLKDSVPRFYADDACVLGVIMGYASSESMFAEYMAANDG